jgi:transglutaminase-like putative cysteine protease
MGRTALLYAPAAALLVVSWRRLEDGPGAGTAVWVAALALLPALVRPLWGRVLAAVAAGLVVVHTAFGVSSFDARPFDDRHDFFGPLVAHVGDGVLAFYDVSVPFVVDEQPLMHGAVLLAIFCFGLTAALAIAARRPLAAALVVLAGAAWPATLSSHTGLAGGAAILAVVLFLLAAGDRRRMSGYRPALAAGAALVAVAVVGSGSPAIAKDNFLDWKRWDPYDQPDEPVSLRFVWDANYGGIHFPEKTTTVLTVDGIERPLYWRATTLDTFDGTRWVEEQPLVNAAIGGVDLLYDSLLPARARDRSRWLKAVVTIRALRDDRLPAPGTPVRWEPPLDFGRVDYSPGGMARLEGGFPAHNSRYTVYAYAPRPSPAQLAAVRPTAQRRGTVESRYLEVVPGDATLPWGTPGREAEVQNLLATQRGPHGDLAPYAALYRTAQRVVGHPRNPYAATVAVEAWLRSEGGFRYEEQPPPARAAPPLVDFVERTRAGYCQHFAGAMTLMLRLLGIPARVAVGFTSGRYDGNRTRWTVTDHDAHAWVEVWFDGWGWLPFDPTPGRGDLSGTYTTASTTADIPGINRAAGGSRADSGVDFGVLGERLEQRGRRGGGRGGVSDAARTHGESLLRLLMVIAAVAVALIAALKEVRRRVRHLARDPRAVAAACRAELADFLADQGVRTAPSATPRELAALVDAELGVDARPFAAALAAARFAPEPEARAAARMARRELRSLRRLARNRLTFVDRLRGLLSVRSLGFSGS